MRVRFSRVFFNLLLILWTIFSVFPFVWTILTSVKSPSEAATIPPKLIFTPSMANYNAVLWGSSGGYSNISQDGFWNNLFNSFYIATLSTIFTLILGTMSSYYVARFSRNRNLSFWILSIRMMPPIAAIIPYYIMLNNVHLVDSVYSLILIYTVFNLPLTVWLISSFIRKLPIEYDEMAQIDGFSGMQFFTRIILPQSKQVIIKSALLSFVFSWNEFLCALVLSGTKSKTLPVLATGFITQRGILWGQLTATSIIMILPILVLTFVMNSQFTSGISMGLKSKKTNSPKISTSYPSRH